jgi:predicted nucleic acid-binding protein
MRLVVSNTGPLLHLLEANSLDLLKLAGEVHIPPAVATEISRLATNWSSLQTDWINVTSLIAPHDAQAIAWMHAGLLDIGEAAAIALAQQLAADWFLTDDAAARVLAESLNIETHGSLGIVLWAAATSHLNHSEARDALNRLAQSSLWISAQIQAEARDALDKLFPTTNP